MIVRVVKVRCVRMTVFQDFMRMHVRMFTRYRRVMDMGVVTVIMAVTVFMHLRQVDVPVLMSAGCGKVCSRNHDHGGNGKRDRQRSLEYHKREPDTNERGNRIERTCSRCTK